MTTYKNGGQCKGDDICFLCVVVEYLIKALEVRRETTMHAEDGVLHQCNWR